MIYLVLSIIFMICLAVVTRKATEAGCNAFCFNAIARYVSGTVMLVFTLSAVDWAGLWPALRAAGWPGIIGAFLFSVATIGATKSVQYGPLGISWTILRCSMVVSTLASLFIWREVPVGFNRHFILCLLGTIFTVGTVIIFGVAKILHNHSAKKLSLKWFLFAMMAFWGQGTWEILLRSTRSVEVTGFREVFITVVFLLSAFYCSPALKNIRKHNWKPELLWGGVFGICGIFASALRVWALKEINGTVVFPVTTVCVTVLVQLLSIFLFKERPEKLDLVAYGTSVCGLSCLVLM
ncbi:MAG: EamA family transporter [Victivallaceae bacterium]|nr:EamA family transporter [Victivallaceae bacterium]